MSTSQRPTSSTTASTTAKTLSPAGTATSAETASAAGRLKVFISPIDSTTCAISEEAIVCKLPVAAASSAGGHYVRLTPSGTRVIDDGGWVSSSHDDDWASSGGSTPTYRHGVAVLYMDSAVGNSWASCGISPWGTECGSDKAGFTISANKFTPGNRQTGADVGPTEDGPTVEVPSSQPTESADPTIARDANGFALGGPAYPSWFDYKTANPTTCARFNRELHAWSNYQNLHRPVGYTNLLPFSGDVQILSVACNIGYYESAK